MQRRRARRGHGRRGRRAERRCKRLKERSKWVRPCRRTEVSVVDADRDVIRSKRVWKEEGS